MKNTAKKTTTAKNAPTAKISNSNAKPKKAPKAKIENVNEFPEKFEKAFEFPVRLFKNLKLENENSYKASAGAHLKFEKIKINENNQIVFRVRRTGRRTFFTTSNELVAPVA